MILNKPIKEYYEEQKELLKKEIEYFCPTAPTLALVEIGENEQQTNFLKILRQEAEAIGINCIWYYYGADDELKLDMQLEIEDISDASDFVYGTHYLSPPGRYEASKTALNYIEQEGFRFLGKNVVVIDDDSKWAKYLMNRGATPSICNDDTGNIWTYINIADLIICANRLLNCYAIHVPVLDLTFGDNGCYNTENRDIPEDGYLLNILDILLETCRSSLKDQKLQTPSDEEAPKRHV